MNINRKCFFCSFIFLLFIGFGQPTFAQGDSQTQKGTASWYGSQYHGKATSSGEPYDKNEMTAAHKGYPFGTIVKVTNLSNSKSVLVRINDRGPFVGRRIIDVSEAAAKKLKIHADGLGQVKVEVVEWPDEEKISSVTKASEYTIQAGSFASMRFAQERTQQLQSFYKHLRIELEEGRVKGKKVHRIKAGRFDNKTEAEAFNELLAEEGLAGKVLGV